MRPPTVSASSTARIASCRGTGQEIDVGLRPGLTPSLRSIQHHPREAERRQTSFSSLITELVSQHPEPLPYAGVVEDDEDLSERVEEVLARLAG